MRDHQRPLVAARVDFPSETPGAMPPREVNSLRMRSRSHPTNHKQAPAFRKGISRHSADIQSTRVVVSTPLVSPSGGVRRHFVDTSLTLVVEFTLSGATLRGFKHGSFQEIAHESGCVGPQSFRNRVSSHGSGRTWVESARRDKKKLAMALPGVLGCKTQCLFLTSALRVPLKSRKSSKCESIGGSGVERSPNDADHE